jgi:hypothetical protein
MPTRIEWFRDDAATVTLPNKGAADERINSGELRAVDDRASDLLEYRQTQSRGVHPPAQARRST